MCLRSFLALKLRAKSQIQFLILFILSFIKDVSLFQNAGSSCSAVLLLSKKNNAKVSFHISVLRLPPGSLSAPGFMSNFP